MAQAQAKARFDALRKVCFDNRLSYGARVLYLALHDLAGQTGQCWPSQETLAKRFQTDPHQIRRWFVELRVAGYIQTIRRGPEATLCVFAWADIGNIDSEVFKTGQNDLSKTGQKDRSKTGQKCPVIPAVSLYDPNHKTSTLGEEVRRSVSSTAAAQNRPTAPPPVSEEPATPEDRLLIGLANRGLATDCRMATQVVEVLGFVPVDFFLTEVLDRKLRRKHRLREEFDLAWLPRAARDAVSAWRSTRMAMAREQRIRPGLESVAV